jgi:hypothetical protein
MPIARRFKTRPPEYWRDGIFLTAEALDRSSPNGEVDCLIAITSRHGGHHLLSAVARSMTVKKWERLDHNHDDLDEFDGASYVAIGQKLLIGTTHLRCGVVCAQPGC